MFVKKEYMLAGISVVCWGTLATISKLLVTEMDAVYALAFTFAFAALALLIYNWKKGNLKKLKRISLGTQLRMMAVGSLGVLFYNLFYLCGAKYLPAQQAFMINDLWPALIIIFSCIILKERFTAAKAVAVVCSILGIAISTSGGDIRTLLNGSPKGMALCAIAAVCYGLYCTLNKREDYDKELAVFLSYASGAVVAFVWVIATGGFYLPAGMGLVGLTFSGIVANALPYLTWALALDMGNTAIIANLAYLVPFVSLGITHFVLGEKVTAYSFIGLILILIGIGVQMMMEEKKTAVLFSKIVKMRDGDKKAA